MPCDEDTTRTHVNVSGQLPSNARYWNCSHPVRVPLILPLLESSAGIDEDGAGREVEERRFEPAGPEAGAKEEAEEEGGEDKELGSSDEEVDPAARHCVDERRGE